MLFDDTTDRAPTIRETATTQSTLCLKLPGRTHSFAIRHAPPNAMWRPVIHRTNHTMTHQAGTTTKAPRQCSECQETSNGRPTLLSDVLRERHLAVNESPLTNMNMPCDDSTDRTIQQSSLQQRRHNQSKATAGRTHVGTTVPSDLLHLSKAVDKSMSKHEGAIR